MGRETGIFLSEQFCQGVSISLNILLTYIQFQSFLAYVLLKLWFSGNASIILISCPLCKGTLLLGICAGADLEGVHVIQSTPTLIQNFISMGNFGYS